MSTTAKAVIAIVVLVLILVGAYWWYQMRQNAATTGSTASPQEQTTLPTGSSTSDASLNQDLSAIDAQLQASNNDTASASESVNADVSQ